MAHDIRLYSAHYMIQLTDSASLSLYDGSSVGRIERRKLFSESWKRGYNPLVAVTDSNREMALRLVVKGTSLDNFIEVVTQLERFIEDAEAWQISNNRAGAQGIVSAKLDGMTNITEWEVVAGSLDVGGIIHRYMTKTSAPTLLEAPLSLSVKPYGQAQAMVRTVSGTLDNGDDSYTLSAPAGSVETPLRLSIQSAAGDTIYRAIGGRKTRGKVSNFIFLMECETGTYTGYTVTNVETSGNFTLVNTADAAYHGGSKLQINHGVAGADSNAPMIRFTINDNLLDFYGRHLVVLRHSDGGDTLNPKIGVSYGGSLGRDILTAGVALDSGGSAAKVAVIGVIEIPHRATPMQTLGSFAFELHGTFDAASVINWYLDCIYLIPIDEQSFDIKASAELSAQDLIVLDGLLPVPAFYVLDSNEDLQPEIVTPSTPTGQRDSVGLTVVPGVDNLWCVLVVTQSADNEHDLTDDFTLAFEHTPRVHFAR